MGATSKNFTERELACHHCHVNGATQALVDALEALRVAASNQPVYVNSAYRCAAYDHQLAPEVKHSQHVLGTAADVRINGLAAAQLEVIANRVPAIAGGGIGRDDFKNYVHVDVRQSRARWCYDSGGQVIAWYPPPSRVT